MGAVQNSWNERLVLSLFAKEITSTWLGGGSGEFCGAVYRDGAHNSSEVCSILNLAAVCMDIAHSL